MVDKEILIKKYFQEELNNEEWEQLSTLLQSDEAFKEEFKLHELLFDEKKLVIKQDVRNKIEEQSKSKVDDTSKFRFKNIVIGILLLAILGMLYFFFQNQKASEFDTLLRAYLEEKAFPPPVLMDQSNQSLTIIENATKAYRSDEYEEAIVQFGKLENPTQEQLLYYGLSHMYSSKPNYSEAIKVFKPIIESNSKLVKDEALWFYSLACLAKGDIKEGEKHLNMIVQANSWKTEEAKILLNNQKR